MKNSHRNKIHNNHLYLCIFNIIICISISCLSSQVSADSSNWDYFKLKFISQDGRVIDNGNNNVSHSEGQGIGMLLAVAHDDPATFDKLWNWTKTNLGLREDELFVWQWVPDKENHTEDFGSASDGDILIAWALARAADKWKNPSYLNFAKGVIKAIRTELIVDINNYTLLLPGPVWPRREGHTIINLSYWIFPAFEEFRKIDTSPQWEKLIQTGVNLITRTRFGSWDLPADWIAIKDDGSISQVDGYAYVFGYEAVRIPLYYLWGGYTQKEILRIFQAFWATTAKGNKLVTILGLATDTVIQQEDVLAYRAVNQLVNCALSQSKAPFLGKGLTDYDDYYSSAVYLMAQLIVEEKLPYCKVEGLVTDSSRLCREGIKYQCPLRDPIPAKINKGILIAHVKDFIQLPQTHPTRPLARNNYLTHAGDKSNRIFIVDNGGKIYVIKDNRLLPDPFLDIAKLRKFNFTGDTPNEMGAKTIAFHPNFSRKGLNGYHFLYTVHSEKPASKSVSKKTPVFPSPSGKISHFDVISEWKIDTVNPDKVDTKSQRELLRIAQPTRGHNLEYITFDPTLPMNSKDFGLLYIGVGDGGWDDYELSADYRRGQDLRNPFGKILRIDPQPGKSGGGYNVPEYNPFVDKNEDILPEIWAYGFRNPKRFSWDKVNGRMYIADIGHNNIEEVNLGLPGSNYGWSHREGTFAINYSDELYVLPLPPDDAAWNFTYPILQYDHDEGNAIDGGFVYRGKLFPELYGFYVFSDIKRGRIFYANVENLLPGETGNILELRLFYKGVEKSFIDILNGDYRADMKLGRDENGEIYVMTKRDGMVRRLVPMQKGVETVN